MQMQNEATLIIVKPSNLFVFISIPTTSQKKDGIKDALYHILTSNIRYKEYTRVHIRF
jgi:hypothetical protein